MFTAQNLVCELWHWKQSWVETCCEPEIDCVRVGTEKKKTLVHNRSSTSQKQPYIAVFQLLHQLTCERTASVSVCGSLVNT
eukprot:m.183424 g.183424  ORF g.183424 m.183424 type:complete len:81 (+) comp18478_c0_seq6:91-333(+)